MEKDINSQLENNSCTCFFDKATDILTESGWKNITELTTNDKIAVLENEKTKFISPEKITFKKYNGDMLSVKNDFVDLLLQQNQSCHIKNKINENYKDIPANQLFTSSKSAYFKNAFDWESDITKIHLPVFIKNGKKYSAKSVDLNVLFVFLSFYIKFGKIEITKSSNPRLKNSFQHRVFVSNIVDKKTAKLFEETLYKLNKSFNMELDLRKRNNDYVIYHDQFLSFLQKFGSKECVLIPPNFKNANKDILQNFIKHLFTKKEPRFYCKNKKISEDILEIILKSGKSAVLQEVENGYIIKLFSKKETEFKVLQKDIEQINFQNIVYIVDLPSTILVKRNGKCCWYNNF
jgi:hypothetical protein